MCIFPTHIKIINNGIKMTPCNAIAINNRCNLQLQKLKLAPIFSEQN